MLQHRASSLMRTDALDPDWNLRINHRSTRRRLNRCIRRSATVADMLRVQPHSRQLCRPPTVTHACACSTAMPYPAVPHRLREGAARPPTHPWRSRRRMHVHTSAPAREQSVSEAEKMSTRGLQREEESHVGSDQIDWRQQWYAVHPIESLPVGRPWPVTVLGTELVVWRDGEGQWRVFDDACPHRKVALSEGRVEDDGTLACAYHGWRFDGEGSCKTIPQLEGGGASGAAARTVSSVPACATSFPTAEAGGLLFVWMVPGADGLLQSSQVPVPDPKLPEAVEADPASTFVQTWVGRELPMSFEVLMENLADPSHLPFAHHKVTPTLDRSMPFVPQYDRVEKHGKSGYVIGPSRYLKTGLGSMKTWSRQVQDMRRLPGLYVQTDYTPEDPEGGTSEPVENLLDGRIKIRNLFYASPVTATSSRLITRSEIFSLPASVIKMVSSKPAWQMHLTAHCEILDGDMSLLHKQSVKMHIGELSPSDYCMPAVCDKGVREFWGFLKRHSKQGINFYPHVADTEVKHAEEVLDRFSQHVQHCIHCSTALKQIQAGMAAAVAAAVVGTLAAAALVLRGSGWPGIAACGAVVGAAAWLWRKLGGWKQKFFYQPYVHQDRN